MNGCRTKYMYVNFEGVHHPDDTLEWTCISNRTGNDLGCIRGQWGDATFWFKQKPKVSVSFRILRNIAAFMSRRSKAMKRWNCR